MELNSVDLFCGCGGLSYGFKQAGFNCILAIDKWQDAIETFSYNIPDAFVACEEITQLTPLKHGEYLKGKKIHIILGGPPCQGYSTVGTNRKGRRDPDDPRNFLFKPFMSYVKYYLPPFVLLENVIGMKTLNKGHFFQKIKTELEQMGYKVKAEVLNASDYGIPQNRLRLFTVGFRTDEFNFPVSLSTKVSTLEAIGNLPPLDNYRTKITAPKEFCYTNSAFSSYQKLMRKGSRNIQNHELTFHSDQTVNIISKIPDGGSIKDLPAKYWKIRKYNKSFQRMNSRLPSLTIDTGHRNYFHYSENRIPSVRESARLQSFPDKFYFLKSKTSQYRQVGNAVSPLLAKALAEAIINSYKSCNKDLFDTKLRTSNDPLQLELEL